MQTRILIFLMLLVGLVSSNAQTNFVRVTDTVLTAESFSGGGAAWADYDGDGWLDLAQANYDGANLLIHNNGDGTFTKVTTNGVAIAGPETFGVSWADFDNDGRPDLFFGNGYDTGVRNLLFHNGTAVDGKFTVVTSGPGGPNVTGHSVGCSWADYDRDGFLDLFVANSGSPSELWHNKGNGTFERVLTGAIVTNVADSIGAAWADYDNDGWPDLFVANGYDATQPQSKNFLYHNNGDGTFGQIQTGSIANDLSHFAGAAWGDYDNDGFLDLFVTVNGGHNHLYHNNGNGTFTRVTQGDIVNEEGTFPSAAWADYDNDGWLDLFVGNRVPPGKNLLYHNNGDGTFTKVTTGPIAEDSAPNGGCAWGDYDNNGFPDLFVSVFGGKSLLYHNERTTNNWFKVYLQATKSNASAIGAKVRVTAVIQGKTVTQTREISTGDGFNGNSQVALFGLSDAADVEKISVEWPSGEVSTSPPNPLPLTEKNSSRRVVRINIFEPQAPRLSISLSSQDHVGSAFVALTGGDPTRYHISGSILSDGETVEQRGYGIEASDDLIHWQPFDSDTGNKLIFPQLFGDGFPFGIYVYPQADPNSKLFFRARDLGVVQRKIL